jgi:apolipoprotein N-acyltransferase
VKIARLAHPIILAWGWQRALIACLAGASATLALAPINFWPAMFVSIPMLVWLIDGASGPGWSGVLAAARTGWWFGFGYFLPGLYWVGYAFLVDAKTFGWLMPVAVTALPAGLALFTALGIGLARAAWTQGIVRLLTLAAALTASEWLRGHLLTGFPWNAFGYTLTGPLVWAQSASILGLWGLTFLAVAIFASPAVLADDPRETLRPIFAPVIGALALGSMTLFGAVRLANAPTTFVDGVRLRIMQPNLPQDDKFNYSARHAVMQRYIALSDRASGPQSMGAADVTHLIWPESAFPFLLAQEPEALAAIAGVLSPHTVLITGAARGADLSPQGRPAHVYNSIYVVDHDGSLRAVYDKMHLVPFGEYLPFQRFLERLGLRQLTEVQGGFDAGDARRAVPLANAPSFLPLICYEVIFPHEIVPSGVAPGWIVNLTNDGWFGISSGPYQHLQQARVRAIEEGLPIVRAANTGVSAVIDPLGRVVASLPLGEEGVLDASLPQRVEAPFYARWGDGPQFLVLAAIWIGVLVHRSRTRRSHLQNPPPTDLSSWE